MGADVVRADDAVDLQLHTTYSDGSWIPQQLFEYLAEAHFRVAAVTDHDHMSSIPEMVVLGQEHGIHVIPAVEVTADWHGRLAHVLCFAERFAGSALEEVAHHTEAAQRQNTREVLNELRRRGYAFPRQGEVLRQTDGEPVRPVDNARLLVAHGLVATLADGLDVIRGAGFRSITADLATMVAAAHAAGGVALIAHPGRRESGFTEYDAALLDHVREEVALDGIEVWYPLHTAEQVAEYDAYARRYDLLRSAGSDSHGPTQRLPVPYRAGDVRELLGRCGVQVEP